jgi:large subunit ribosomal protein L4
MAKAKLFAGDGTLKTECDLPAQYFEQEINEPLMHLAVKVYLANQRQGTHKTKGRSEVSGGGHKPWKQKGTGRARQGSNTAPNWARGGKAHGPTPRDYRADLNKKMRRAALISALSAKAKDQSICVFETFSLSAPKTKEFVGILNKAALRGQKNIILVTERDENLHFASRNVPNLKVWRVQDLNTYEVLNHQNLIFTDAAVQFLSQAGESEA